jgi:hypothetical protein
MMVCMGLVIDIMDGAGLMEMGGGRGEVVHVTCYDCNLQLFRQDFCFMSTLL